MSLTVSVEDIKEHFEELLQDAAERKEEIVVAKNGATVATVVPAELPFIGVKRVPGCSKGQFVVPDDFNDPLPDDILDLFYK